MPAPRVVCFTISESRAPTWINPQYVACVDVRKTDDQYSGHTWIQTCWGMSVSVDCPPHVAIERLFPGMNVERKG